MNAYASILRLVSGDPEPDDQVERLKRQLIQDASSTHFASLADIFRRKSDYKISVLLCREGLKRHPSYAAGHLVLARALAARGDRTLAIASYRRVLEIAPGNLAGQVELAELLEQAEDHSQSLVHWQRALELGAPAEDVRPHLELHPLASREFGHHPMTASLEATFKNPARNHLHQAKIAVLRRYMSSMKSLIGP